MKGFGMLALGKAGWIEKEAPTEPGYLNALLRPIAVSPCTSDTHTVFHGSEAMDLSGRILGHEAVAEVLKVGEGVKDFKPGDKVIVSAGTPDWLSIEAQNGVAPHSNGFFGSLTLMFVDDGVFSECFRVTQADANLIHLPEDVSIESALMLTDMGITGFSAAKHADIKVGDSVLVLGIGPVGLMGIASAKLHGAGRIIGVGSRPNLIEKAKIYGATDIVNRKEGDITEQVMKLTNNKGVDKVIIAGGNKDILTTALACSKPGAIISNVNYFSFDESIPIDPVAWGAGMANKTIKGFITDSGRNEIERLLELVKYNRLDPSHLVTHKFYGFDKIEDAFHLMNEKPGDLIKPIVYIDHE